MYFVYAARHTRPAWSKTDRLPMLILRRGLGEWPPSPLSRREIIDVGAMSIGEDRDAYSRLTKGSLRRNRLRARGGMREGEDAETFQVHVSPYFSRRLLADLYQATPLDLCAFGPTQLCGKSSTETSPCREADVVEMRRLDDIPERGGRLPEDRGPGERASGVAGARRVTRT